MLSFAALFGLAGDCFNFGTVAANDEPDDAAINSVTTAKPDDAGYREIITPFMTTHCLRCHGPKKQEGEFRVDEHLSNDFNNLAAKQHWGEVVNVLNSHEMPPEEEPQPGVDDVAKVVDWITLQTANAEAQRRDSAIVLRRLNRAEYHNTIRDLFGVDFDTSVFPQDPPAGGFDNIGGALTLSPLHLELYIAAARDILDHALVEGEPPPSLKWRFQPESGDSDSNRVEYDKQRLIVNGGNNKVEQDFIMLHHEQWDMKFNVRDFALPYEGEYVVRIRAGGVIPPREEVVTSAEKFLKDRLDKQMRENPKGEKYHKEAYERDMEHFRTDRMYDYGPPRLKLTQHLAGQPRVIDEIDIAATKDEAQTYEFPIHFTAVKAGLTIEAAYSVPRELENFWMQGHAEFERPELWVDWMEIEGPVYESWPSAGQQQLLFDSLLRDRDERGYAREVIRKFMRRAYRRPVSDTEVDAKLALFDSIRPDAPSFIEAIKSPLVAVMVSPHFLYLAEPGATVASTTENINTNDVLQKHDRRKLTDHEFASRLSYFLWSTMPDEELYQLAEAGTLQQADVLSAQIKRMLADPKSRSFVENFAGQWLGLRDVGANPPAEDLYPRYDRHLEMSIIGESEAFFAEILHHELSVMNFVKSDFVVINERLARYYGIPGVKGNEFQRVDVPAGVHRGGILTQASILSTTSNGTRTSPVKRGTWVMKNVLGIDPGLPVANAGEIAPKVPGIDKATVRQRLEIHRQLPQCARCHNKIDPLGFALENFNAAGEWRDQEGFGYKGRIGKNDPLVDASAKLLDGTEFVGVDGLRDVLMQKEKLFLGCLAGKLYTYALGRELGIADQLHIKAAVSHMQKNGDTLPVLIEFIVKSEPFGRK